MLEEDIGFHMGTTSVFYNPKMTFCRSFCSLAVGALDTKLNILDGFSASGIRGIRYAKENKVSSVTFLDFKKSAITLLKKNKKKNKVKGKIVYEEFGRFLLNNKVDFDLIEIDPFGTPVPYLYDAIRAMNRKKSFYLSATATDTAVLCGPESKACMRNYHSKSLNNEFTHENGIRILLKTILDNATEFNFGIEPIFSLSNRHYLKVLVKLVRSAESADESIEKIGYTSFCSSCGWRSSGKKIIDKCAKCKKKTDFAGPLWLGELHDKKTLQKMKKLNQKRDYGDKEELDKTISLMLGEIGMPPNYYNVHQMCKRLNAKEGPKLEALVEKLKKKGFKAERTHFSSFSIKTNAPFEKLKRLVTSV